MNDEGRPQAPPPTRSIWLDDTGRGGERNRRLFDDDEELELRALVGHAWESGSDPERLRKAVDAIIDWHDRRHIRAYERRLRSRAAVLQVLRETNPTTEGREMIIPNPQRPYSVIKVCDECGWPPALDGRCLCSYPEHRGADGKFPDYAAHMLELRERFGLPPIPEHN
jgi:hypothetical protein